MGDQLLNICGFSRRQEVETKLRVLLGLPVFSIGRTANLQWFQFGNQHIVPTPRGGTKTVGDYALHVQCAWRIRTSTSIIAASQDRYVPVNGIEVDSFDWDKPGNNLCDHRISNWLREREVADEFPLVTQVDSDEVGSLRLTCTDNFVIEVFPDTSLADEYSEHWRFFRPASEAEHFVVSTSGLGYE